MMRVMLSYILQKNSSADDSAPQLRNRNWTGAQRLHNHEGRSLVFMADSPGFHYFLL